MELNRCHWGEYKETINIFGMRLLYHIPPVLNYFCHGFKITLVREHPMKKITYLLISMLFGSFLVDNLWTILPPFTLYPSTVLVGGPTKNVSFWFPCHSATSEKQSLKYSFTIYFMSSIVHMQRGNNFL